MKNNNLIYTMSYKKYYVNFFIQTNHFLTVENIKFMI